MSLPEWLAHPACRVVTLTLLHFFWQGLLVAVGLVALVKLLNIERPSARYVCSLAALVAMTLLPVATLAWISRWHVDPSLGQPEGAFVSPSENVGFAPLADGLFLSVPSAPLETFEPYVLLFWAGGVVFFASRLILGAIGVAKLRRSRIAIPPALAERVMRLGRRMQLNATGIVFLSNHVTEAMALGLVKKLVLIPAAWATEMPLDMLEAVIAHELAHLKRMDLWTNFLQRIVETLFFYHPAVWWLSRRLRVERELCSDELAVAATGERLVYAQTLEHIANGRRSDFRPGLAAFLRGEGDMRLLQRIQNVLSPTTNERRHWPAGLVALGLAICLWTLSLALFGSLAPSARAADEPAQEEAQSDDDGEQEETQQEPSVEVELVADIQEPQIEAVLVAETQDPQLELEFVAEPRTEDVDVDTSEIIERAVAEAVKKALAQVDMARKKEIDKAVRTVDLDLKKVHQHHLQLEKQARDKALVARKKASLQAAEADKLKQKLQWFLLEKEDQLRNKADEKGKLAKARKDAPSDGEILDKAVLQQANDQRIEELTAMVKELSAQVKQLSNELNDLREVTGERQRKDDDSERLPK